MICQLKGVSKQYPGIDGPITILQKTDLIIQKKEFLLIIGPSGSGKTTLLSLIGGIIYPTTGELFINGQLINHFTNDQLADLRLKTIGFVFQSFNLLAPLTALENVKMPLDLLKIPSSIAEKKALAVLDLLSMADKKDALPKALSGGQQQRVAIARALATAPEILLCDEPTASLDKDSAKNVMENLRKLADQGQTIVVVTHDARLKTYADRIVSVESGVVYQGEQVKFDLNG